MASSIRSKESNRQPLLSILIPTKNRAYYLRYAIQSAINVASDDIEIIVSENHGVDDGWQVANSFLDPRLSVLRPKQPLPMHENFEFLLKLATGRWVTFIGDDDAVMPHCAEYLRYLDSSYPEAEAIVSPRAYYYWKATYSPEDQSRCAFSIRHFEVWRDSKEKLQECLSGAIDYINLPQMYSGGFHRRSLIQRVLRLQGGHYFRSVTPDAYSAVMAVLHTYRYIEVGVPMTWIGTSPQSSYGGVVPSAKDRTKDFIGMHSEDTLQMNPCLGNELAAWPFLMHFFEAYLSASPFIDNSQLSYQRITEIYKLCATKLILNGDIKGSFALAKSLGVAPINPRSVKQETSRARLISYLYRILSLPIKASNCLIRSVAAPFYSAQQMHSSFCFEHAAEGFACPDILSTDQVLKKAFEAYCCMHLSPKPINSIVGNA
jgi:glycosyltransferase involved in cell wall biosynthesis